VWSEILSAGGGSSIFVSDPFNAVDDPALPTLPLALEPTEARHQLKHRLPMLAGEDAKSRLKAIRVVKHKPSKRCLVEYELRVQLPGLPAQTERLIGKVRAKRFGKEGYRLQQKLWLAGFDSQSADGISVPEPIGVIPHFQMWLQRKVNGTTATHLLSQSGGAELAGRIADAIHKLHLAKVPTERRHGITDELRILHDCLARVAEQKPELSKRLERIASACDEVGGALPEPPVCGVHRDFYPAQVIVASETAQERPNTSLRLYLIDFDLYCLGDPALDVGNFIGHMTEQSLREFGDACALAKQEHALEDRFVALEGEATRAAVKAYTILTLVRHIYLSTQAVDRQPFTVRLLELCECRLGLRKPVAGGLVPQT
jgi:thiamine kinase-like enzyme